MGVHSSAVSESEIQELAQSNPAFKTALEFAKAGIPVIPCSPTEKKPCIKTGPGHRNASTDPKQLYKWAVKFPGCAWGMVTGWMSGIIVLDVDLKHNGFNTLDQLDLPLLNTPSMITGGGGRHYYFQYNKKLAFEIKKVRTALAGYGIDIQADKRYVVLPDSPHKSGNSYQWEVDSSIADIEAGTLQDFRPILDRIKSFVAEIQSVTPKTPTSDKPRPEPFRGSGKIPKGCRKVTLQQRLSVEYHNGTTYPELLFVARFYNKEMCEEPLSDEAVVDIVNWLFNYGRYTYSTLSTDPHGEERFDELKRFLKLCTNTSSADDFMPIEEFHRVFGVYLEATRGWRLNPRQVKDGLKKLGFIYNRDKKDRFWTGLKIKTLFRNITVETMKNILSISNITNTVIRGLTGPTYSASTSPIMANISCHHLIANSSQLPFGSDNSPPNSCLNLISQSNSSNRTTNGKDFFSPSRTASCTQTRFVL